MNAVLSWLWSHVSCSVELMLFLRRNTRVSSLIHRHLIVDARLWPSPFTRVRYFLRRFVDSPCRRLPSFTTDAYADEVLKRCSSSKFGFDSLFCLRSRSWTILRAGEFRFLSGKKKWAGLGLCGKFLGHDVNNRMRKRLCLGAVQEALLLEILGR